MRLFRIVSDASSFISDTESFTETLAATRALSLGTSLTTAKPRTSLSAWPAAAVPIARRPNSISKKDKRDTIAYLLCDSNLSREPIVPGWAVEVWDAGRRVSLHGSPYA